MDRSTRDRHCQSVPDDVIRKALSESMQLYQRDVPPVRLRNQRRQLEEDELCSVHGAVKELLHPQQGSAVGVALLPRAREAAGDNQGGATCQCAVRGDLENGFCTRNGSVTEPLDPRRRTTTRNKQKRTLGVFLAAVKWIRSHPKITLGVLILHGFLLILLALVLSLLVTWVVVSGRSCAETPVTPVNPVTPVIPVTPVLLACPLDWIGHRGICYFLSRDQLSWDQAQARCSELGASLAVLQDWEMEFLSCLTGNEDHWVGLRRRGRELQWGDGSSFNSSVPVYGTAECVYLSENYFGSLPCSNPLSFICSRAQTRL